MASQLGLCYVPPVATAAGVFDMVERRASDSDAAAPAGVRRASAGDRENRLISPDRSKGILISTKLRNFEASVPPAGPAAASLDGGLNAAHHLNRRGDRRRAPRRPLQRGEVRLHRARVGP